MNDTPQKLGGGLMFRNSRKTKPNHPDYTGNEIKFCCPACHAESTVAVAAWEKQGKRSKFFSLSFSPPRQDNAQPQPTHYDPPPSQSGEHAHIPEEQEIPF